MAPKAEIDDERDLVFEQGIREMHRRFLDVYRGTPHPEEALWQSIKEAGKPSHNRVLGDMG